MVAEDTSMIGRRRSFTTGLWNRTFGPDTGSCSGLRTRVASWSAHQLPIQSQVDVPLSNERAVPEDVVEEGPTSTHPLSIAEYEDLVSSPVDVSEHPEVPGSESQPRLHRSLSGVVHHGVHELGKKAKHLSHSMLYRIQEPSGHNHVSSVRGAHPRNPFRRQKSRYSLQVPAVADIQEDAYNHDDEPLSLAAPSNRDALSPAPGQWYVPPVILNGGASARASAARQREEHLRASSSRSDSKIFDSEDQISEGAHDRESGIGVSASEICLVQDGIVGKDPATCLPVELMAEIFSYLDGPCLIQAMTVNHLWNQIAMDPVVWKKAYRRNFSRKTPRVSNNMPESVGLGRDHSGQDWRQYYLTRLQLENRWRTGKAAAIYLQGHTDSVYCVQFDEEKIVTGSRDRTIRIWSAQYPYSCRAVIGRKSSRVVNPTAVMFSETPNDARDRNPFISVFPHKRDFVVPVSVTPEIYHTASILCLQYDRELMVTGSSDSTCIVWDINTYAPLRRLEGHTSGVLDVCLDDDKIVSCSKDQTICIWDRHTGALTKTLEGHQAPVNAVQLRGDLVASASGDSHVRLWNVTSGRCIREFRGFGRGLACVEFSADGRTIYAGGNDQLIYEFDAHTGDLVRHIDGHADLVRSLHLDSDHGRIVSGSYDMSVKVFDAGTGRLRFSFSNWTASWMLSAKSDYRRIVATGQDSRVIVMDFGYGLRDIDNLREII